MKSPASALPPAGDSVSLGAGRRHWRVSPSAVDLTEPPPPPRIIEIEAAPHVARLDIARSAMIVIDMQNDFLSPGGVADSGGRDLSGGRATIDPLKRVLPILRQADVPIIWLNWGNRPDRMNLPPPTLYGFNPDGRRPGIGGELPGGKGRVLEQGGWPAAIVPELVPEEGDIHVAKYRISGFWDTPLDSILRNLDIRTAFFAGVNIDVCVLHTIADAAFLGYNCILLEDCAATSAPDFCHQAAVFNVRKCFGLVSNSAALVAGLSAGTPAE
ncbi:cysteine hydrolase [Pseudomonas sp. R2.Fl]|nr:cysteine hydrolase [Pseudomonas sp. R2.Fl]